MAFKLKPKGWSGFRLVSVEQARAETGLTLEQLLKLPEVELLTRVYADGRREEALRMPRDLGARRD